MPHVVIAAAMATPSGYYRPLIEEFRINGWNATAVPHRGFDRDLPRASPEHDWGYADVIADIQAHVDAARSDGDDVLILGHSQGSQFALGVQLGDRPADGLVTVGASNPDFRHFPFGGAAILFMGLTVPVVTRLAGYLPKPWFGAPGAATLMREWAYFARTGRPPFEVDRLIDSPAFVIHLQGDPYAVSAANKAYTRFFDPEAVTRWVYTKDIVPHAGTNDHMAWVKTPDLVVDKTMAWWAETKAASPEASEHSPIR